MRRKLTDAERLDWLRLARTPTIGPVTFAGLIGRFKTAGAALEALPGLAKSSGRKRTLTIPSQGSIEREISETLAFGARVIAACEPEFPTLLAALDPPPPIVVAKGRLELASRQCLAVVGARNASAAGRKLARDLAGGIGREGYCIVSGLARGIDGEAHAAALETGTVAVLGGGVDHIYPPQHEALYASIAERGLIISESPLGYRATARDFPRRNRFISGMSQATLVVEASERSGSLITARMAGEQGRDVMAVPGSPLDPRASGTNRLLREGAHVITCVSDALDVLRSAPTLSLRAPPGDPFETDPSADLPEPGQVAAVEQALSPSPMPVDEIARAAGLSVARTNAILMELELAGRATTLPGGLAALAFDD